MQQFTYRKAIILDVAEIAKVRVLSWQSAYKGIIEDELLNNLSFENSKRNFINALEQQGEDGAGYVCLNEREEVVGFSFCGTQREEDRAYEAEICAIYILSEYHRMGIGRRLFQECCHFLHSKGKKNLLIWALKENKAKEFYATMGGSPEFTINKRIGSKEYPLTGWTWEEIPVFDTVLD